MSRYTYTTTACEVCRVNRHFECVGEDRNGYPCQCADCDSD